MQPSEMYLKLKTFQQIKTTTQRKKTLMLQIVMLHYPDVYQPSKPVILQQTRVPNSLPVGVNYVDYEPQGTEVIQACLQTTPYIRWPQWFSTTPE